MYQRAFDNLPKEKQDEYKRMGESMHEIITKPAKETYAPDNDSLFSLVKAGMHPNRLTREEYKRISDTKGKRWWSKLGYREDEIEHYTPKRHA